jgi:DNA-directed RNA polymerase subunit K/omega
MAQARKRALELEQHAYTVGKDPYRRTPPVEHAFQAGPSP